MSCYPCFTGCAALFLLGFQVDLCVYSKKLPGFCLLGSVRRKISVIFSYFSSTQLKTGLEELEVVGWVCCCMYLSILTQMYFKCSFSLRRSFPSVLPVKNTYQREGDE